MSRPDIDAIEKRAEAAMRYEHDVPVLCAYVRKLEAREREATAAFARDLTRVHERADAAIARADRAEAEVHQLNAALETAELAKRESAERLALAEARVAEMDATYRKWDRAMEPLRKVCKCTDDESPHGCVERTRLLEAVATRAQMHRGDDTALNAALAALDAFDKEHG